MDDAWTPEFSRCSRGLSIGKGSLGTVEEQRGGHLVQRKERIKAESGRKQKTRQTLPKNTTDANREISEGSNRSI